MKVNYWFVHLRLKPSVTLNYENIHHQIWGGIVWCCMNNLTPKYSTVVSLNILRWHKAGFGPPWCHGFLGVYQLQTPSPTPGTHARVHDSSRLTAPSQTHESPGRQESETQTEIERKLGLTPQRQRRRRGNRTGPGFRRLRGSLGVGGHHLESSNADGWSNTFLREQVVTIFLVACPPAEAEIKESSRLI